MGDRTIEYECAKALWNDLSPTSETVPGFFRGESTPIYRGQADANWDLLPSFLRGIDSKESDLPVWLKFFGRKVRADELIFNELTILDKFASYCDYAGIKIPNDSTAFRESVVSPQATIQNVYYKNPEKWPNEKLFELMALAQHHGAPTRLLDWTYQSYVALYFAVSSALKNKNKWDEDSKIAIWIFNSTSIGCYRKNLHFIKVPSSTSKNLPSQNGAFTTLRHDYFRSSGFEVRRFENEVSELDLVKLTISTKKVHELYSFCQKMRITAATMYPSADGVGRAVIEDMMATSDTAAPLYHQDGVGIMEDMEVTSDTSTQ